MILADLGAEVVRIERKLAPGAKPASELFDPAIDILNRNRRVVTLDLKKPEGLAAARQLIAAADGLIEGYRPGVMERLGLGPDECLAANPRLVYGRMTGWGQTGPLASPATTSTTCRCPARCTPSASPAASRWCPQPGGRLRRRRDAAGGGRARRAARSARSSGRGQVVDAAMTDGSALLMTMMYPQGHGPVEPAARQQPPRRRRPLLRHLPLRRRQVRFHRPHRAPVLRPLPAHGRHHRPRLRPAVGPRPLARAQGPRRRPPRHPPAGRMVRTLCG
jgi:crotonobetainyl-CoA:carnitine CoA-transferase CaiB-like acyl-CoA transferase